MKKYKSIIILAVILVLSIVGCIATFADSGKLNNETVSYKQRLFAPKTKTLSLFENVADVNESELCVEKIVDNTAGGESIATTGTEIKYKNTVTFFGEKSYDVYLDNNENEYRYNVSGKLTEFKLNAETSDVNKANASDLLTEQEAVERAKEYAHLLYGNEFEGYELEWTHLSSELHQYTFGFTKKYKFVNSSYCFIDLCTNGLLLSSDFSSYNKYNDFDESLLDGITEQDIEGFVREQIELQYSSKCKGFEIKTIGLQKFNNKYYIDIVTDINIDYGNNMGEEDIYSVGQDYYYALD